jgi:iron complex outermembrane receptor protein
VGIQGEWELRNAQSEWAVSPSLQQLVNFNVPNRSVALFTQQEWRLSTRWKVSGGLRFDRSHNYGNALSPRIALVYQPSATTALKFVYGSPFRNPSAYEKYFNDNENLTANLSLHAERANTFEASAERKLGSHWTGIVDLYQYRTRELIEEVFPDQGAPQFQQAIDSFTGLALPNSPRTIAKLRFGTPVVRHSAFLSSSVQYMGARGTDNSDRVRPVLLQELTLTSRRPVLGGFDLQAGIRNLWNRRVDDPVGLAVDTMRQDGRSFFLKLIWQEVR